MARGVRLISRWAWPAVALLLLGAPALVVGSGANPVIDWQPLRWAGEPWRWWSAAWVHLTPLHLAGNLLALLLVAALGALAQVPLRATWAWLLAWPLTHLALLARPTLQHYGGLSGVLHAGVVIAALCLLTRDAQPRRRWVGAALLAGTLAKVLLEAPWAPALPRSELLGVAVVPLAHAGGALAGLLAWALMVPFGRAGPRPPPQRVAPAASEPPGGGRLRRTELDGYAIAATLLCCVLWGFGQVATKVAVAEIPPLLQAGLRSGVAALLVAAWARGRGIRIVERRDPTWAGGFTAGTLFAAEFACIFIGVQYTTASRMAVFIYLAPFVVALGMPFVARSERLDAVQFGGLLLAFAGVAWAFAEGFTAGDAPPLQWFGDALGVTAALLWGATTLVIRATSLASAAPEKTLLYQLGISGLALLAASWFTGESVPARVSDIAAASLVFQTVVITFASYLLWFWLVRHYPATRLSAFTLLTPVVGLLAGAWWLSEPVTLRLVAALAAVVVGIAAVNRGSS